MKKTNTPENAKDMVVSFRLSSDEFAPYAAVLARSTVSKSAFFRSIFISNKKEFHLKESKHPDYKRLLFFVSKASNNINQIAKRINIAEKAGIVTSKTYFDAMNELVSISQLLKGVLDAKQD